jgi:Holliday junction DNA helicase RuvA
MYDHLVGEVCEAHGTRAVLRCGGVGYELKVPVPVSSALRVGETAQLFTQLHVVDGTPSLLAFGSRDERELARHVLAVSGVGPAIALALLSTYPPAELAGLLVRSDSAALKKVKGVGAKTAERLCLELRDKIARLGLSTVEPGSTAGGGPATDAAAADDPVSADAVAALVTLGYAEADAVKRVVKAREQLAGDSDGVELDELIRHVLRG